MSKYNPSESQMQKYNLNPLPDDFEPTAEEKLLLQMYETVKAYEKTAARLKDEAARAKLAAKDAEFQEKINPKRRKRTEAGKPSARGTEDAGESADDQTYNYEKSSSPPKQASKQQSNSPSHPSEQQDEDVLRQQYLSTTEIEAESGPLLKRKKFNDAEEPSSLIASMAANTTPPHEFSKKLELNDGETLFPTEEDEPFWEPPAAGVAVHPNEGAFTAELKEFDVDLAQNGNGNNTLAIKFTAPSDSKRFSINIATQDNDDFESVLFHFNPRHHERGGQLVINDKQEGIWGQAIAIPLSQLPLIFGQTSCTLLIQINGDGYDVFLNDKHCARLEHRQELVSGKSNLVLQFPSTDDYGSPENWRVLKVWWGACPIKAKSDLAGVAGVNSFNSLHPRKLFISGLTKLYSEADIDLRIATLERDFRKYGGDRGVKVIAPPNTTYAFVEMDSEQQCDLALQEMAEQYRLNRARRSRHEALQEERAAAEGAARGEAPVGTTWD